VYLGEGRWRVNGQTGGGATSGRQGTGCAVAARIAVSPHIARWPILILWETKNNRGNSDYVTGRDGSQLHILAAPVTCRWYLLGWSLLETCSSEARAEGSPRGARLGFNQHATWTAGRMCTPLRKNRLLWPALTGPPKRPGIFSFFRPGEMTERRLDSRARGSNEVWGDRDKKYERPAARP